MSADKERPNEGVPREPKKRARRRLLIWPDPDFAEPTFRLAWDALRTACCFLDDKQLCAEYAGNAREWGLTTFATMVVNFLYPTDQPDYALVVEDIIGPRGDRFWLGPLRRDVERAYLWLTTPRGRLLEHGWMARGSPKEKCADERSFRLLPPARACLQLPDDDEEQQPEAEWSYRVQSPEGIPHGATVFILAVGAALDEWVVCGRDGRSKRQCPRGGSLGGRAHCGLSKNGRRRSARLRAPFCSESAIRNSKPSEHPIIRLSDYPIIRLSDYPTIRHSAIPRRSRL